MRYSMTPNKNDLYRDRKRKSLTVPTDWQDLIEGARKALEARNVDTSIHRKGSDKLSESAIVEAALRWVIEQHRK